MFFAIAALLIQPHTALQLSISAERIALIRPEDSAISNTIGGTSLPATPRVSGAAAADAGAQPVADPVAPELPDAPGPVAETPVATAFVLAKPSKPLTVSVNELIAENRRKEFVWKGLLIASSGAATFDAWSTRRAVARGAQELNPMLKPFAGNASLYAAVQVGPVLMDYVGRKMMYSSHGWVRRMWWAPQTVSIVSSLFCGTHNLSYQ